MIYCNLSYRFKKASSDDIIEHLNKCTNDFNPPLNKCVNIIEYGGKIYNKTLTFECWNKNKLIGLIAAYFNDFETNTGFITNVSVIKEYQGYGIASKLLSNTINYAKENKFNKILLEVYKTNNKAIKLYEKYGFKMIKQSNDKIIMEYYNGYE